MSNLPGTNFWDVLSAFAWPGTLGILLIIYRSKLTQLVDAFTKKFERASEIKLGNIELKGPILDPTSTKVPLDGNDYSREAATSDDFKRRNDIYENTRSLMLAHRIRPSKKAGQKFDISVFLVRKTSKHSVTARLNDVDFVEYYFGGYFGEKPHGSKFIVRTSDNGFAVSTSAYGSPLCVAKIHFHDGVIAETYRYLDFEMESVFVQQNVNPPRED